MKQFLPTHINHQPWPQQENHSAFAQATFIGAKPCEQDAHVLSLALDRSLKSQKKGLWLEFGTGRGDSTHYICKQLAHRCPNQMLHTFDSGEGLPENWRENFPKGTFAWEQGEQPQLPKNATLHIGWFENSLPTFIGQHKQQLEKEGIAFLSIDCDLYSSTKTILENLSPYLTHETVVFFDELYNYHGFEKHEWKAWAEYLQTTPSTKVEYIAYNKNQAQVAAVLNPNCVSR
jgi:Methyltransferase domain